MSARAIEAVRRAAGPAGDVSGNCDAAVHYAERGDLVQAARELEWAQDNLRDAAGRIAEARAAIAQAQGLAQPTTEE